MKNTKEFVKGDTNIYELVFAGICCVACFFGVMIILADKRMQKGSGWLYFMIFFTQGAYNQLIVMPSIVGNINLHHLFYYSLFDFSSVPYSRIDYIFFSYMQAIITV
jgi:hypothetical protein